MFICANAFFMSTYFLAVICTVFCILIIPFMPLDVLYTFILCYLEHIHMQNYVTVADGLGWHWIQMCGMAVTIIAVTVAMLFYAC